MLLLPNGNPFIGHIVSRDGVATDLEKIAKVAKWPEPTLCREVQQFLRFANYYQRFVKDYTKIARPLHRLTEQNMTWLPVVRRLPNSLWQITSGPHLSTYSGISWSRKTIHFGPRCQWHWNRGSVLTGRSGRKRSCDCYMPAVLTDSKPEGRYCVTRKELLAIVFFCHYFRPYTC